MRLGCEGRGNWVLGWGWLFMLIRPFVLGFGLVGFSFLAAVCLRASGLNLGGFRFVRLGLPCWFFPFGIQWSGVGGCRSFKASVWGCRTSYDLARIRVWFKTSGHPKTVISGRPVCYTPRKEMLALDIPGTLNSCEPTYRGPWTKG